MKNKRETLIIGSRESLLAVRQARIVLDYLRESCPDLGCDLHTMKTTGDRILDKRLDQIGGKGLFVRELDQALRAGRTDLSVHSLKDVPAEVPEDLPLIGFSEREDPRDVLVLPAGAAEIDFTKPIGSRPGCASWTRVSTAPSSWRRQGSGGWGWRTGSAGVFQRRRSFRLQDRGSWPCREGRERITPAWMDL